MTACVCEITCIEFYASITNVDCCIITIFIYHVSVYIKMCLHLSSLSVSSLHSKSSSLGIKIEVTSAGTAASASQT